VNRVIITILTLSASGSVLALLLFAWRPFLKNRVSQAFRYYIWLVVLLRLVLPFSPEGSLMGRVLAQAETAQASAAYVPAGDGEGT